MRLEGLRPQPGLHGSPSDAKHRPGDGALRRVLRGDGENARLLTMNDAVGLEYDPNNAQKNECMIRTSEFHLVIVE